MINKIGLTPIKTTIYDRKKGTYTAIRWVNSSTSNTPAKTSEQNIDDIFNRSKIVDSSNLLEFQQNWVDIGKKLGVDIIWIDAPSSKLKGALHENKIYLDVKNNTEDISQTFYHELFHLISYKNPLLYKEIVSNLPKFSKQQLDSYRDKYKRPKLTDSQVINEILCDNFSNAQYRVELLKNLSKDTNLFTKLLLYIKYLTDKVKSVFVSSNKSGLSKKQYDEFVYSLAQLSDSIPNSFSIKENQSIAPTSYLFAGYMAETANVDKLDKAKQLEAEKKSRSVIFNRTGWIKGKDNKWRFEIPDNPKNINFSTLLAINNGELNYFLDSEETDSFTTEIQNYIRTGSMPLYKIYNHQALYNAYPEIKNIPVSIIETDEYNGKTDGHSYIYLNKKLFSNKNDKKPNYTLIHEIQHIIQTIENFTPGSSTDTIKKQIQSSISNVEETFNSMMYSKPDYQHIDWSNFKKRNLNKEIQDSPRFRNLDKYSQNRLLKLVNQYNNLTDSYLSTFLGDYDKYYNTGGEQEAREAANRANKDQLEMYKNYLEDAKNTLTEAEQELKEAKDKASEDELALYQYYLKLDKQKHKDIKLIPIQIEFYKKQSESVRELIDLYETIQDSKDNIKIYKNSIKLYTGTPVIHDKNSIIL